jgi:hypothetical protein
MRHEVSTVEELRAIDAYYSEANTRAAVLTPAETAFQQRKYE